jgi:hypothetical protein
MDVAALAGLLRETTEYHHQYEKSHPPHNWWDWYVLYSYARQHRSTPGSRRPSGTLHGGAMQCRSQMRSNL